MRRITITSILSMYLVISLAIWLVAVTIAITIHEFAHALASEKLGDPTARLNNRLSLNPLNHYDPVGTTMLLVTSIMRALGAPVIPLGWAKPVPFDPYNLENPKRDGAIIALSGPAANLLFALLASLLLRTFLLEIPILNVLAVSIITVNVALAIFNLIPIHPLDGGKILYGILPVDLAYEFETVMRRYGLIILLFMIMPMGGGTSPVNAIISPAINFFLRLLLP